ncbi:MAG: beta-eliminating lyase-related protein [Geminicoccaceae bacterium]
MLLHEAGHIAPLRAGCLCAAVGGGAPAAAGRGRGAHTCGDRGCHPAGGHRGLWHLSADPPACAREHAQCRRRQRSGRPSCWRPPRPAGRREFALHLDGARLWNAALASGASPAELAAPFDTVSVCFSKRFGWSARRQAGTAALITKARRFRGLFGGGMRQGRRAAAALHALDHQYERLLDDHAAARRLAFGLAELGCFRLISEAALEHRHRRGGRPVGRRYRRRRARALRFAWTSGPAGCAS